MPVRSERLLAGLAVTAIGASALAYAAFLALGIIAAITLSLVVDDAGNATGTGIVSPLG
ncbi:MAG TPA: hypothetical protein VEJ43_04255 [Pseudolabrys sp.]|nr:hypothetical protein [Pseudolabrys sp.]